MSFVDPSGHKKKPVITGPVTGALMGVILALAGGGKGANAANTSAGGTPGEEPSDEGEWNKISIPSSIEVGAGDDVPEDATFVLFGSIWITFKSGWEYRIDPATPGIKRHIHIRDSRNNKEWAKDEDGSNHHPNSPGIDQGLPPKAIRQWAKGNGFNLYKPYLPTDPNTARIWQWVWQEDYEEKMLEMGEDDISPGTVTPLIPSVPVPVPAPVPIPIFIW